MVLVKQQRQLFLTCLIIVTISVPCVLSIRCWVCRSDTDETCADPFNNYTAPIINCDEIRLPYGSPEPGVRSNACRYGRYKTLAAREDPEGKWVVIRDCAYLNEPCDGVGDEYHCSQTQRVDGSVIEYTTCTDHDGCNHAAGLNVGRFITFLSISVTLFILN